MPALGEPASARVVVGQPLDVVVERVDAGSGDDPGLPHRATEEVLLAPRALHQLRRSREQRPERTAEALREAERDGVEAPADLRRRDARRDGRVEEPRAVEMGREADARARPAATARARGAASTGRPSELCVFSSATSVARWSAAFVLGTEAASSSRDAEAPRMAGDRLDHASRRARPRRRTRRSRRAHARSATSTSPGRVCSLSAIWFAIVAVGTKSAASWPSSAAARSCSAFTVGSSRFCSSPTSAAAIAARIPSVGRVAVSERRSITGAP